MTRLLVIAALLAGCAGAPIGSAPPPQITYVTPAPVGSPAEPTTKGYPEGFNFPDSGSMAR